MANSSSLSLDFRTRKNLIIAIILITVGILCYVLPQPLETAQFRGEPMEVYSISGLFFRLLGQLLWITAGYFLIQILVIKFPQYLSKDTLLYKVVFLFLILLASLAIMGFLLKGIFTEDALRYQ